MNGISSSSTSRLDSPTSLLTSPPPGPQRSLSRLASSSSSATARSAFPSEHLRPYVKTSLSRSLTGAKWDPIDKSKLRAISKEISERVKQKMVEIKPRGFKYIVTVTLSENQGQAGRADMSCHWEETDSAIQEMWSNESIIFVCVAFAVRVS